MVLTPSNNMPTTLTPEQFKAKYGGTPQASSSKTTLTPQQFQQRYPQANSGNPGISQGSLQGTMTTPPTTSAPSGGGFWSGVGGAISGLAKSIVKPVVQTVAAPFQAVDFDLHPDRALKDEKFNLPWLGEIAAPTSVKQQVGRSLETVGVGLGPVAGGAALGAGQALDEGKSLSQAALQAGIGAVAGKVLDYGVGKIGSGIQKLGTMSTEGIAKAIEKSSLPLTAVQRGKMTTQLDRAANFLFDYGVKGDNVTRFDKVKAVGDQFEKTLQDFLDTNNTKIAPVSKSGLISALTTLKTKLMKDSSVAPEVEKQINSAIDNLTNQYRFQKIPIARLNILKRSTFDNAYSNAGDKVLDWVEHDIGDVYKTAIEKATKGLNIEAPNGAKQGIEEFNKSYGDMLNAKKILKLVTANGAQAKPVVGKMTARLIGSLIGGGIGYETGGTKGAGIGAGLGLLGAGKADVIMPILETLMGANSRSQLVGALKYLSEHLDTKFLSDVTKPVQSVLKKTGGVVKDIPKTLKTAPAEAILGTGEIPGVTQAKNFISNKIKSLNKIPVKAK